MVEGSFDISAVLRQGVYMLLRGEKVVYVGKSKCMLLRVAAHRSLARRRVPDWLPIRGIVFDNVHVIPCHPDRIDALERGLIDFYQPHHNVQHRTFPTPLESMFGVVRPPEPEFRLTRRL